VQLVEVGVSACAEFEAKSRQNMLAPLRVIPDPGREARWMQRKAKHVDGRLQQLGRYLLEEGSHRSVRMNEHPVAIDRQSWPRLVRTKYEFERVPRTPPARFSERLLRVNWSKTSRDQPPIAFSKRYAQVLSQFQSHLSAGLRSPRFQKAQMARR
jgi:hypothetical protein